MRKALIMLLVLLCLAPIWAEAPPSIVGGWKNQYDRVIFFNEDGTGYVSGYSIIRIGDRVGLARTFSDDWDVAAFRYRFHDGEATLNFDHGMERKVLLSPDGSVHGFGYAYKRIPAIPEDIDLKVP